jgi:PAS domain S-box-containing protein
MPPQWFRALMDAAPEVYFRYTLTPASRLVYVSRAIFELTGYTPEALCADARLCVSLVPREGRRELRRIARGRRPGATTLVLRRIDGAVIPVRVRAVPVIRQRQLVAIEGIVTLACAESVPVGPGGPLPEPAQLRLAALLSEVQRLLHREVAPAASAAPAPAASRPLLTIGDVAIDSDRMIVTLAGRVVDLTTRELLLLRYLGERRGRVLTRTQLLEQVWGYRYTGDDRTVDVHISRLRSKLPPLRELLTAVKHVGYRLENLESRKVGKSESREVAKLARR